MADVGSRLRQPARSMPGHHTQRSTGGWTAILALFGFRQLRDPDVANPVPRGKEARRPRAVNAAGCGRTALRHLFGTALEVSGVASAASFGRVTVVRLGFEVTGLLAGRGDRMSQERNRIHRIEQACLDLVTTDQPIATSTATSCSALSSTNTVTATSRHAPSPGSH